MSSPQLKLTSSPEVLAQSVARVQEMLSSREVTAHELRLRENLEDVILAELTALVRDRRKSDPKFCLTIDRLRDDRELMRHVKRKKVQIGADLFEVHYGGPEIWSALDEKDLKALLVRFVNYLNSENIQQNVLPRLAQLDLVK